jgi:transposase
MRFYTGQHRYYCGIDLHARTMYLCILDHESGEVVLHRNLRCEPERFLRAIEPYRDDLVVGVECIFCWYWLADLCTEEDIPFVLGHALYMKAIHGGKAKNDKIDAHKIAVLLRIRIVFHQLNLPAPTGRLREPRSRVGLLDAIPDPIVRANVEADLALAERLDEIIRSLELTIRRQANVDDPKTLRLLKTIPGVGRILALTLLYELHDIDRFPRVQDFLSYARLVKSQKASAGKVTGTSGAKIGNAHLKWAYSEAAVLFLQKNPRGQRLISRLRSKHGKGKALSILAARLGRASYFMLRRSTAFDMDRFVMN